MIERMDHEIGRILAQIKSMGVFDDTLIVFLSDNGASAEIMVRADGHDPKAIPGSAASHLCLGPGWSNVGNTPYRRHKTWVHEGGACTPFIAHWPKGIAAGSRGSGDSGGKLRHDPGHVIDLVPTVLALAGVKAGSKLGNKAPTPFAGRSLLESFAKPANWQRSLWWYHEGNRAMRVGDWKIVSGKNEAWELFDLKQDRTESNNLADAKPKKVAELEAQWQAMINQFRKVAPQKAARPKGKGKPRNKK